MKRIINTHTLFFIEYNVSVLQNNQLEQFNFFVIVTIYLESRFSNLLSFHPLPSSAQNGGEENREALIRSIRGDSNANSSVFFPNVFVSRTTTYIESSRPLPSPDICQIFIESSLLSPRTYKHSYIIFAERATKICNTCIHTRIHDFWRLAFVSRLGGEISGGQAATIMLVHARSRA